MHEATLIRQSTGDEGTIGVIIFEDGFGLHTLELPWENNQPNISCIPCGLYMVDARTSPRFGMSYHVCDVRNRTHIIFHKGNWAGKAGTGLHSNVKGCILVGHDRGIIEDQQAVLSSAKAVDDMYTRLKGEPFQLLILSRIADEQFITS
jgi:hypothetical protein